MTQQLACAVNHLDHVGIAVNDLRAAMQFYKDVFGISEPPVLEEPSQGLIAALLEVGQTRIELLQATRPDSAIGRFIADRGQGLHHLGFGVDDIYKAVDILKTRGVPLTEEQPREGLTGIINFVHPKAAHGVLIELVQPNPSQ